MGFEFAFNYLGLLILFSQMILVQWIRGGMLHGVVDHLCRQFTKHAFIRAHSPKY